MYVILRVNLSLPHRTTIDTSSWNPMLFDLWLLGYLPTHGVAANGTDTVAVVSILLVYCN